MNINTVSVECAHNCCSECTFEDCACGCHLAELLRVKTVEIQDAGFFRDRAWYEENDPQSLVDSLNGNVNCPHNALHKMRPDGLTFTAYRCGNCATVFEVAEHKEPELVIERLTSGPHSPWGTRLRQA